MAHKHTPEPWEYGINPKGFYSNEVVIRPAGEFPHGEWIADVGNSSDSERIANARRIVAAVNACAGVDTDALQPGMVAALQARIAELEALLLGGDA